MFRHVILMSLGMAALAAPLPAAARTTPPVEASQDRLSRMFAWWNTAMATPGQLTRANFGRFFTPDATLTINGEKVIADLDGWVSHFLRIQSGGGKVEIVVPFKTVMQSGSRIYTYHVIRSVRNGQATCWLAAGDATLRGQLISSINLVRVTLDKAKGTWDKECWDA